MNFIGLLRTLEAITRPPRMGHDDDLPLPDYEPVSPDGYYGYAEPDLGAETEPGLTPDELVGVRGLLQERYEPNFGGASRWGGQTYTSVCLHRAPHYVIPTGEDHQCYCARPQDHPLDDYGHRPHICRCGQLWADLPTKSSASNHAGTGAESAPSPTIVQSAPPPTVDGEGPASVRDIQPSPEAGRPTSELLNQAAAGIEALSDPDIVGDAWHPLIRELRDRAATFKAIEE